MKEKHGKNLDQKGVEYLISCSSPLASAYVISSAIEHSWEEEEVSVLCCLLQIPI